MHRVLGTINPPRVESTYKTHQNRQIYSKPQNSSSLSLLNICCIYSCVIKTSHMSSPSSSELVSDLSCCSSHNIASSVPSKSLLIKHFLNDLVIIPGSISSQAIFTHCVTIATSDCLVLCVHFCNAF